MSIKACIPIISSADIEKSLRFWVEGLGLTADRQMRHEGRLIGCMVHNDMVWFWLNESEGKTGLPEKDDGIRLYWTPADIHATRERLRELGYQVTEIEERDYGQTEFFAIDDDGYAHCFGVDSKT
jgi:catechol 2,3-dioxygenase-like lactoylglutathione lyase family enzyme